MIRRKISKYIQSGLKHYPVATLLGPRQVGKTTLAKSFGGLYFDLEKEGTRTKVDVDWDAIVNQKKLVILDEAQTYPEIFSRLRSAVDEDRHRNNRFLLLGSVSQSLMKQVTQSLAGRMAIFELTPILATEIKTSQQDQLWLCGGYPDGGIQRSGAFPSWQNNYISTLTERDLPTWGLSAKPQLTKRLLSMIAVDHGQLWNASRIGQSLGINYSTVNSYTDWLEGAFIVRRLYSYHANIGKRLRKRPKFYIRDSGLLHSLMNVSSRDGLLGMPWVGASWEGFVIEQILNALETDGKQFGSYYFRTSNGVEIDLVLDFGSELWAIEIKLTSNPSPGDLQQLTKAADMIGATRRVLVSRMKRSAESDGVLVCNLNRLLQELGST